MPELLLGGEFPARPVVGVHLQTSSITGVWSDATSRHPATTKRVRQSVAYDSVICDVVGQACVAAGAAPNSLAHVVVGVSYASLHRSRVLRRVPTGPYWRDALATTLEYQLATRVSVASAVELAALAESRSGLAREERRFVLVQNGTLVEACLFGDARPQTRGVVDNPGDRRSVLARLRLAVEPLLRSSGARLVVVGGTKLPRRRSDLCADLRAALIKAGIRQPTVVPTGLVGDPVIAGALHVARTRSSSGSSWTMASLPLP